MSRFYATVDGQSKTTLSKCGSKKSGMSAHIRGWDIGCRVKCRVNADGKDIIHIHATGGSNGQYSDTHIATLYQDGTFETHNVDVVGEL